MAYVFRKKGSRFWWIGFTDSAGRRRREPTKIDASGNKGKTEAKQFAIDEERKAYRLKKGLELEVGKDKPFAEWAWEWFGQLPKSYRSKDTAETYLRQRILPFLGKRPARAITREDVISMLNANEKDRKGRDSIGREIVLKAAEPGTLLKLRAYVHSIFEWLIEDKEIVSTRNPAGGKRMRERVKVPKRLPRYITVPELVALLLALPEDRRLMTVFAVVSGVRKGELIPLLWEDVRLSERKIHINKSRGWNTTKTMGERFVAIPEWLLPVFESHRSASTSLLLFPNKKGKRQRFDAKFSRMLRTAAKAAGLVTGYRHTCRRKGCGFKEERTTPIQEPCPRCSFRLWVEPIPKRYQFKDLRSTFGTLATAESGDLRYVQQVLGHGSFRTTETHYVHALTTGIVAKTDALQSFRPLAGTVSELGALPTEIHTNGAKAMQTSAQEHETD